MIRLGHDLQRVDELTAATALAEPGVFFTAGECAYAAHSKHPASSLAGLFCAKEAAFKALPTLPGVFFTDIEILHDPHRAPELLFHGVLKQHCAEKGLTASVSISHSGDYASAVVVVTSAFEKHPAQSGRKLTMPAPLPPQSGPPEPPPGWADTSLRLAVRPSDLDSLGHVNNAVALEYLEAGRWAWLEANNLATRSHIVPVVARIEINYRCEISKEELFIHTELAEKERFFSAGEQNPGQEPGPEQDDDSPLASTYQVIFAQRIEVSRKNAKKVAVDARVQVAFIDTVSRTPTTLFDYLAAAKQKDQEQTR